MKKLLLHPFKLVLKGKATPHCDELSIAANILGAELPPEALYSATLYEVSAYFMQFDEIIVNCFQYAEPNNVLKALLYRPQLILLVNDPAYAYDCGLDIAKVLYCGDPKLYNEASAIAAARAGKKQTKPCETAHFPLFIAMWELMPSLPQASGQPAGIAYAGFSRAEYRHAQIQYLLQSNIPATLIGYSDVPARAGLTQHSRMSTNESYIELAKLGACIIAGDEEYYTLGKFAHRLHQAYALNCIAFVHESMAQHCLNKELAELLGFGTAEELELKWANAQCMHSEIRTLQKAWAEQCKQESLAFYEYL
jgi:hypothetical protein